VNALLIGLKTITLTARKSSLAHALNRETLPLRPSRLVKPFGTPLNLTSVFVPGREFKIVRTVSYEVSGWFCFT